MSVTILDVPFSTAYTAQICLMEALDKQPKAISRPCAVLGEFLGWSSGSTSP